MSWWALFRVYIGAAKRICLCVNWTDYIDSSLYPRYCEYRTCRLFTDESWLDILQENQSLKLALKTEKRTVCKPQMYTYVYILSTPYHTVIVISCTTILCQRMGHRVQVVWVWLHILAMYSWLYTYLWLFNSCSRVVSHVLTVIGLLEPTSGCSLHNLYLLLWG